MKLNLHPYGNIGLFVLRVVVGIIFLYHGYAKWGVWTDPGGLESDMLIKLKILSVVEPIGGIALLLGVMTEFAALGLSLVMVGVLATKIVAMRSAFSGDTFTGWEFELVLLSATLFLFLGGGGTIALSPSDD